MRRIKDATGVSDVNEIIQKFQTQGDTLSNLKDLQQENDRKQEMLQSEISELKLSLQKIKFESLEGMTRKQIDEVEKNLANAELKFERNKMQLERINKVLVSAKAGIEHLCEKLIELKLDGKIQPHSTLDDALIVCEQKVTKIMEELKDQPHLFKEIMAKVKSLRSTKKNQEPLKDKDVDNVIVSNTKNNI